MPKGRKMITAVEQEEREEEIQVSALQGQRKMYTIDQTGKRIPLGLGVTYRDYEGQVRVPMLGSHVLGRVSKKFVLTDHATALQPFRDAGFSEVSLLHHYRSGAMMLAVLSNPDVRLKDYTTWDKDLYEGKGDVMLAVRVTNTLFAGVGPQISLGYFRVICQNGLIARDLGLGDAHYTHTNYSPTKVKDWLTERMAELQGGRKELPTRPSKILDWPIHQLKAVAEDRSNLDRLPKFARGAVSGAVYPTKWSRDALIRQLELARKADTVSPLDLLNALTNAARSGPKGVESQWGIYHSIDPLYSNLRELADIGCFVAGEPSFNAN